MVDAIRRLRQDSFLRTPASTASLLSGSSGNSIHVAGLEASVLVDAGVSCRRLETALAAEQIDPHSIDGILVTHEHSDHVAGLDVFCRRYQTPIYINVRTWLAIAGRFRSPSTMDVRFVEPGEETRIGDLTVRSFATPHDAVDPVGWRIDSEIASVGVMTDLGCFDSDLHTAVAGCDVLYIEANYDPEMLRIGPYPWSLKERIASATGHLSNGESAAAILALLGSGTDTFVLSHLSESNNVPDLAQLTVSRYLQDAGLMQDLDYRLLVAPRYMGGQRIALR